MSDANDLYRYDQSHVGKRMVEKKRRNYWNIAEHYKASNAHSDGKAACGLEDRRGGRKRRPGSRRNIPF